MFLKLFKHSFMKNMKVSVTLLAISPAISLISASLMKIAETNADNAYVAVLSSIAIMCSFIAIGVLCSIPTVLSYVNLHKAFATDEAYLTFTIPATTRQQLNSRILSIICWTLISVATMIVSYLIFFAIASPMGFLRPSVGNVNRLNANDVLLTVELIILCLSALAYSFFNIILAIIFNGFLNTKMKSKWSSVVLVIIILYAESFIMSLLIGFGLTFAISLRVSIHVCLWVATVIVLGLAVLFYYLSYKILDRGLNLA